MAINEISGPTLLNLKGQRLPCQGLSLCSSATCVPFNPNINTLKLYNSSIEDYGLVESLLTYRLLIARNTVLLNVHYSGTDRISGKLAP